MPEQDVEQFWQQVEHYGNESFLNKCPVTGGVCLNPMCLMGCIEKLFA